MMRQTGGSAVAATSTKSSPCERASCTASRVFIMPSWSPFSAMTRTCGTRIRSLMRVAGARRLSGRCPRPRNEGILPPPQSEFKFQVQGSESWARELTLNLELSNFELFVHQGTRADEPHGQVPELFERHRADVAPRALADGDLALFHLAVAADEHERNLLQLRVAYLRADLVPARISLDAESGLTELT